MDERVEVSVENALRVADLVPGAVVLDELVRMEDIAPDRLAAEPGVGGTASFLRQRGLPLLLRPLDKSRLQHPHRGLLVRRLRALVLALDDDATREMRDPNGAIRLVDVLATGSLRTVRVDLQVVFVDLDLGVIGQKRRDDDRCERRVAPVGAVERALTDEAVLAPFGLENSVGVLTAHGERGALQARFFSGTGLDQLRPEPALRDPALVHPKHHLSPVLCVGAPRAGLEGDDRIAGVVFAVEEGCLLEPLELAAQRHDRALDLGLEVRLELEEPGRVFELGGQPLEHLDALRDPRMLGRDRLRALLVVPEARLAHGLLELGLTVL